jgi:hypothetical protein
MIRGCGLDFALFMNKQTNQLHPFHHGGYGELLTEDGTKISVMYGQVHTAVTEV